MIKLDGENFEFTDVTSVELYFDIRPWLEARGGTLVVKRGNLLSGTCPIPEQPMFVLRFTQ